MPIWHLHRSQRARTSLGRPLPNRGLELVEETSLYNPTYILHGFLEGPQWEEATVFTAITNLVPTVDWHFFYPRCIHARPHSYSLPRIIFQNKLSVYKHVSGSVLGRA